MKGQPNHFKRAKAMFAAVAAAMSLPMAAQALAMTQIGPYVSRGKGQGGRFLGSSARCVAMDKRDARKARNRARERRHG